MAQSSPIANGHANYTPNGPSKAQKPRFFTPPSLLSTKRKKSDSGGSPNNRSSTRPQSFHELDAERNQRHRERVDESLQEHEAVRERACRAHELFKLEMEKRRLAQALEEQEEMETARREVAQREDMLRQQRREGEENQKRHEQQRLEEDRAKREEAVRLEERIRIEERESLEKIKREEAEAAQERVQQPTTYQQPTYQQSAPQQPSAPITSNQSTNVSPTTWDGVQTPQAIRDAEHKRYLDLHQSLKKMRKQVLDHAKSTPGPLKSQLGNWRREIIKTVGQLTDNNGRPPTQTKVLQDLLLASKNMRNIPNLDARHYMVQADPTITDTEAQVSGAFIYELNIVAKCIIRQLTSEASAEAKTAGPVGLLAIAVFSRAQFRFGANGNASLIDILLAKLHKLCPVLFGIWGDESTQRGRERLGWGKDDMGAWLSEQNQFDRVTGIAAGYASMSLRYFPPRGPSNPYPPTEFWKSLAQMVNVPPNEVTQMHMIVVKAMVEAQLDRFKKCFGDFAVKAALRKAVVDLPAGAKNGTGRTALAALPTILRMQHKFQI